MLMRPFGGKPGSARVLASATVVAGISIVLDNTDETIRITVVGGGKSIMARIDPYVTGGSGTATSVTDGLGDTPILPNTSLPLNKGRNACVLSLGPGPDGNSSGGFIVVQTGDGGVV